MLFRCIVFWIISIHFWGSSDGDRFTETIIEEILPTLINPKLILNFLKNATALFNHWRNVTESVNEKNYGNQTHNNSILSEYVQGFALKYPKKYKKHEFEPEPEGDNNVIADEGRSKRGVVHLANMISCATGCNPIGYKGYGCYCGFLGSGYPVDGIDRCCKQHDWCYDVARCPMYLEYFVPYYWKCWYSRPYCALEHGEFGGPGSCADRLCQCDRQLSMCLKQFRCPSKRAFCKSSPFRLFQNVFMLLTPN